MVSSQPEFSLLPVANPIIEATASGDLRIQTFREYNSFWDIYSSSSILPNFFLPQFSLDSETERKMVSLVSRTGRHLQRYNDGCRQVVGCIPYRYKKTLQSDSIDGTISERLEVLVISSQKGKGMMFPKGGWECDESLEDAALRETVEEAGVLGQIGYKLGKWKFMSKSEGTSREGYMFSLLVEKQLDAWPEKHVRQRKWMRVEDARKECQYAWMKEALDELLHRLMSAQQKEEKDETASL